MVAIRIDVSLVPANSNISINTNGGAYVKGNALSLERKLEVASIYERHFAETSPNRPNLSIVAQEAKVSPPTVAKIADELDCHGSVQVPPDKNVCQPKGVGAKSLPMEAQLVLLRLLEKNPFRTRRSYVRRLYQITGISVSESTISRFFLKGFPIKGSLRKPDLIPRDKFKPENVAQYFEYINFIRQIDPRRLKFGDEKLLKGAEVYCKKGRRHVLTGETPQFLVNGDFRNTYAIIGFCGIDRKAPPLSFSIHDEKNDSYNFSTAVTEAIAEGFLRRRDVLVLDNAAIHAKGDNTELVDWLWEEHGIAVLFLPTRSPELNPIELVWRSLVMKLRSVRVSSKSHACADAAFNVLANMTHDSILATYRECKYVK